MSAARRLVRRLVSVLMLCGFIASFLEGAGCDERFEVQGSAIASVEWDHAGGPGRPTAPCCPCIHTYPSSFTMAVVTSPVIVGYATRYTFVAANGPDRSPEPLVPPPIA